MDQGTNASEKMYHDADWNLVNRMPHCILPRPNQWLPWRRPLAKIQWAWPRAKHKNKLRKTQNADLRCTFTRWQDQMLDLPPTTLVAKWSTCQKKLYIMINTPSLLCLSRCQMMPDTIFGIHAFLYTDYAHKTQQAITVVSWNNPHMMTPMVSQKMRSDYWLLLQSSANTVSEEDQFVNLPSKRSMLIQIAHNIKSGSQHRIICGLKILGRMQTLPSHSNTRRRIHRKPCTQKTFFKDIPWHWNTIIFCMKPFAG